MKRLLPGMLGAVLGFGAQAALAGPITYTGVTNDIGPVAIVIDLTTDGKIGALAATDITSFSLYLTDGAQTYSDVNLPGTSLNYAGGLIATATAVTFNFASANSVLNVGITADNICYSGSNNCGGSFSPEEAAVFNSMPTQTAASGQLLVATASVPEPASAALLAVGLAGLGVVVRRSRAAAA